MGTRAAIIIKESTNEINIYHHCDGYPEGVGQELTDFASNCKVWESVKIFAEMLNEYDDAYRYTSDVHGDEEYIYLVDIPTKTIICYDIFGDEYLTNGFINAKVEFKRNFG